MQVLRLLGVQLAALVLVALTAHVLDWPASAWGWAGSCAVLAAVLAGWLHDGGWWRLIHLFFPLAALAALQLDWPSWAWLLAFALTVLVYGAVWRTRVPLYLSNDKALSLLAERVPKGGTLLDLGGGTGTVLAWFGRHRPDVRTVGVEAAWLPWLIGRVRLWGSSARWLRGDLQAQSLAGYDVVYAYLSPAAMGTLWRKVEAELDDAALFVSNTFEIPDQPPAERLAVGDWKGSELLLWRR